MDVNEILDHELQGVSAAGELCSCGTTAESWLEHLGEVATDLMGAKRNRAQRLAADGSRTRRVLAQLAADDDALGEALEATGLTGFMERSEWLIAHRSPLRALAWERKWGRDVELVHTPRKVFRFTEEQLRIAAGVVERLAKTPSASESVCPLGAEGKEAA